MGDDISEYLVSSNSLSEGVHNRQGSGMSRFAGVTGELLDDDSLRFDGQWAPEIDFAMNQ